MCDIGCTRFFRPWNADETGEGVGSTSRRGVECRDELEDTIRRETTSADDDRCRVSALIGAGSPSDSDVSTGPVCVSVTAEHPETKIQMANDEYLVNTLQRNTYLPDVSLHRYDLASGSSSTESDVHTASLVYNFPAMLGMYASRMDQAVERVHMQDAAAKQMKKLRPKKFRCELCDVAFSNNGQLKGHIRIHTGERPFKCDAEGCGKSFTRNEELTRHKRIHTGVRPHGCIVCGKHFGRKDHLKKHMRTHENRDPYRVSAAALGMFAIGQVLPQAPPFPPYLYPF